ncbi:MAG: hypothetical protein SGJ05_12085 [bacterium]|nr:hypothetical protein [bacterium]
MIDAGCTVTLSCQKRVCAGTYELNVLSASYAGACSLWTAGGRIQQALNMIVHQNLMNFQPGAPSAAGTYHWRISRPACWQSNEGVLSACSDECCVNNLDVVKKTGCADFQVATETVLSPPRACPPSYYDNEDVLNFPNCTPACGAFYPAPGARP